MKRHLAYARAVFRHKWFVFLACFRFSVPIWSAILHDWDKFLPDEWLPYARTFYAPDGTKQYIESPEFAHAWMLHQHRNQHHWQYWLTVSAVNVFEKVRESRILVWDRGVAQKVVQRYSGGVNWLELRDLEHVTFFPEPMPDLARREMLADWFGAGRAYNKDWTPLEPRLWYEKNKEKIQLHPETRRWVEAELTRQELRYKIKIEELTPDL